MKKKIPNIASVTRSTTVFAPEKVPLRKSDRSSRGQPLALLEQDERRQRDGREREGADDAGRSPAVVVRLDQRIRKREQAEPGGDERGEVETLLLRAVLRLVDEQEAGGDGHRSNRHVDVEDRAPTCVLGQQAAHERPDRERRRRDADPDADRRPPLPYRECGCDD